jgi:hypothetical protein
MSDDAAVIDGVAGERGLSQLERVVDAYIAPSKTFNDILRSTSWWLPCVLMIVFSVTSAFVVGKQVGWDRVAENQVHLSPKAEDRMSQLTPEQRASQMAMSARITKMFSYGLPVVLLILFALYSLVIWGSFNFGLGARTTFGQVFAVSWYASVPYLIASLLGIITVLFGANVDAYDIKNPVGTNLAYYLPDAAPMSKALLVQLDLIRLWSVVLMILGMAIVAKKTIMQSAVVVLIWWVVGLVFGLVGAAFS